ncbi:glycosyl transferase family 2 [Bacillus cereus]|uniref:Glycosyl transferase family 2 n=1 Tax=Bacillus cereus TaxID=1396 RepID=A0A1S9TSC3_BACCE|nr:glycosyltransferase family 2 protein [Bacillus cereus]OOR12827.1 glycosyl transferase family 2 [Bacillus cereus]
MGESELPLVSVVIPAYNRPKYLIRAIVSVLQQTYKNIEVIVCDDSTNNNVQNSIQPLLNLYPQIKYFKNEKNLFLDNWHRCYETASGEYINFLMDDDLFHPQKIEKMMSYYLKHEDIALVTSFRETINEHGKSLPPIKPTVCLFNQTTILDGKLLGNYILTNSLNVIGEGTTVLFRKEDLTEKFGTFKGKQYCCLNDVATWMSLLAKGKAVYIPEGLSYFRLHPNQNSRTPDIVFTALREWLDLIIDSKKDGFLDHADLFRAAVYNHQINIQALDLSGNYELQLIKDEVLERIDSILKNMKK